MILYALVVRTKDGLPLSASTDFNDEINRYMKESNRYLKMIANRASHLPERCQLHLKDHSIYLITSYAVTCLVLTDLSYSPVLAFSFLSDVLNKFSTSYNSSDISQARRPYNFIEFDNSIHQLRQVYNRPQGLTARVNFAEVSSLLKLNPPYSLTVSEIEPLKNGVNYKNLHHLGVGSLSKLEPLAWYAYLSLLPAVALIGLDLYRALSAFQVSNAESYDGALPVHSVMFLIESLIRVFQVYLLLNYTRYREAESWFCTAALFGCIFIVWELRSVDQQIIFIGTTMLTHVCTITRRLREKLPDYNV